MRELGIKNKKQKSAIYRERFKKHNAKLKKKTKTRARLTKKIPRILLASTVLAHLKSCGFSAQAAKCGHKKNVLTAGPTVFAHNCQSDKIGILYLE